ncbi:MAG: hypothetical protein HQK64_08745 [Desulfamplus sp.]|nr:hypothetical protein [Desulfamplus sp.]
MIEKSIDEIYDAILADQDLHKVFYMREANSSECFDAEKALETARKSNFKEAMDEISLEELF